LMKWHPGCRSKMVCRYYLQTFSRENREWFTDSRLRKMAG